jgi:hypothetical protein
MCGSDKKDCDNNLNKIISNVVKETIIQKDWYNQNTEKC